MKHVKLKNINLKKHAILTEAWLQDVIANDPSILGLGELVLKDKERIHRGAGRLDLLLQEADGHGRFEVEIQLGATDESHIIRTIEYWDIERKKYPQYDHVAVIIAEDITSRFLNVISLFNGFIPLMAIQVTAIEVDDGVGLQFTKVLDTVQLGMLDEDEATVEITDRRFWETERGTPQTVAMADQVLELVKTFHPKSELSYNKHYIGFWLDGRAVNFAIVRAQKNAMRLEIGLQKSEEIDQVIEHAGLDMLDYDSRWGKYRIRIPVGGIKEYEAVLLDLLKLAYEARK